MFQAELLVSVSIALRSQDDIIPLIQVVNIKDRSISYSLQESDRFRVMVVLECQGKRLMCRVRLDVRTKQTCYLEKFLLIFKVLSYH